MTRPGKYPQNASGIEPRTCRSQNKRLKLTIKRMRRSSLRYNGQCVARDLYFVCTCIHQHHYRHQIHFLLLVLVLPLLLLLLHSNFFLLLPLFLTPSPPSLFVIITTTKNTTAVDEFMYFVILLCQSDNWNRMY